MDEDTIGKRVRYARRQRGFTQSALGERSALTMNTINRIENAHMMPSAEVLNRIARALNVPVGDLFPQEDMALPKKGSAPVGEAGQQTVATDNVRGHGEAPARQVMVGPPSDEGEEGFAPALHYDFDSAFWRITQEARSQGLGDSAIRDAMLRHVLKLGS